MSTSTTVPPIAPKVPPPREPAYNPSTTTRVVEALGPGLITGAADDDPSGIATYSQVGAQFGYQLGWTIILTYPLMCAIQQISAVIGRVTGRGLAGNLRRHYPAWMLYSDVGLGLVLPHVSFYSDHITAIVAVFGTTISPYLFFWQAGQEVERTDEDQDARPLLHAPRQAEPEMQRIRIDTYVGMAFSNIVALFIIITAAATLHASGHTDVQTSAQAAEVLRPLAGQLAFTLFAAGIIGTGLLALASFGMFVTSVI